MELSSFEAHMVWGNLPPRETMLQIGNNTFHVDGNLEKLATDKEKQAAWIHGKLGMQESDTVLELGPGLGIQTRWLADRVKHIFAVDASDGFRDYFESYCGGTNNVTRVVRQFFPMLEDLPDRSIDCGFAIAVFCHLNVFDVYSYLEEIAAKLRAGGRFYLNFQNCDNQHFGEPFQSSMNEYRNRKSFGQIHLAQLQYHSRDFFRAAGMRAGMSIAQEYTNLSYTEMMYVKVDTSHLPID